MRKVYKVNGWQRVEVAVWVKAESKEKAMNLVESMDLELTDYCDNSIGFFDADNDCTELSEGGNYITWEEAEEDEDHDYDKSTARYGYEIWLDGNMIHSEMESEFEDEAEAESWADDYIEDYIVDNNMPEDDETLEAFETRVIEL